MSISVRWHDQHHLYYEFIDKWTWDDLYTVTCQGIALIEQAGGAEHIIIDMQRCQYVPVMTADHLNRVARITEGAHASGGIIFLGAGHFVRLMIDIFRRIHPQAAQRFHFAESADDLALLLAAVR